MSLYWIQNVFVWFKFIFIMHLYDLRTYFWLSCHFLLFDIDYISFHITAFLKLCQFFFLQSAKLRKLPPFLTISLLRFNFDFVKCERYKETSCYTFPLRINLKPFCEQVWTFIFESFSFPSKIKILSLL